MKSILRLISRLTHAVNLRCELAIELLRLARTDKPVPKAVWWSLLKQPAAVDDAIYIRRFAGFSAPVLIVDAGGNTGFWAEKMVKFFAQPKIIGFEPASREFGLYRERFKNNADIAVHQVALSDASGVGRFALATDPLYSQLAEAGPAGVANYEEVQMRRLDEYAEEINEKARTSTFKILKVDVQGHELKVLQGARGVLPGFDLVYLECSFAPGTAPEPTFAAASQELLRHGFHPVIFRDFGRSAGPYAIERDVIFVKAGQAGKIAGY